jgi:hypothetical protein
VTHGGGGTDSYASAVVLLGVHAGL